MEYFAKQFCRLITQEELDDHDVIQFFDIVQSVVPTKLVMAYSDEAEEVVSIEVMSFKDNTTDRFVYEIILEEKLDPEDGDIITSELESEFDFDFEFEASIEV